MHYWVYIVACNDNLYYTGVTNNLERRLYKHNNGINRKCFTYKRRPVFLCYCAYYTDVNAAIVWEKQLKGWSRKKKEALFRDDWETIKTLATSYSRKNHALPDDPSSGFDGAQPDINY